MVVAPDELMDTAVAMADRIAANSRPVTMLVSEIFVFAFGAVHPSHKECSVLFY
jgi:hypothetical protein